MRLGFTGTRSISHEDNARLDILLHSVLAMQPTEVTTGACIGFDALAGFYMLMHAPQAKHRVIVPADRSRVEEWWAGLPHSRVEVIEMPAGSSYRDRNKRILDFSDELIVCADRPESDGSQRRSGTWMTARIARERDIPTHETILSLWRG